MSVTRAGSLGSLGLLFAGLALSAACARSRQFGFSDSVGFGEAPSPDMPTSRGVNSPCPGFDPPLDGTDCSSSWNTATAWDGQCEYGHDLERRCNDVFTCSQFWQRSARSDCWGRCPDTIAEITPGAPCDAIAVGCSYLEGTCACVMDLDDAEDAGPGGAAHWRCVPPPGNGCPAQRPSLGSDCVRPMTCDYGACALGRDLVYACPGQGSWIQGDFPESCP
ncbi:MAG: hypothetical protein KF764_19525 [Labilithrix sp.]|nr:hypothetical protein [Labilithrix sp.]